MTYIDIHIDIFFLLSIYNYYASRIIPKMIHVLFLTDLSTVIKKEVSD